MKTLMILILFLSYSALASYGHKLKSYEGTMPAFFYTEASSLEEARGKAKDLSFLHSKFMVGSLIGGTKFGTRGAISFNFSVNDVSVSLSDSELYRVDYTFKGIFLIEDKRELKNFAVSLPLNPEETFNQADRRCVLDDYYVGAEFVYFQFWSPAIRRCSMIPGKDFTEYPVQLVERKASTETYPRYEEMVHNDEVAFYFYFGSDYENMSRFGKAGATYENLRYWLKKKKFRMVLDDNYENLYSKFQRWEKEVNGRKIIVKQMLGNPLPNTPEAQEEYFWFMKDAIENGSFIQYTGHAGHGAIMDLTALGEKLNAPVKFPKDRFQLIYLNGCLTYVFATDYFPRMKGGYQNLHLLGNGDVSWADAGWASLEPFLTQLYAYFTEGKRTSYQTTINEASKKIDNILGAYRNTPMLMLEGDL